MRERDAMGSASRPGWHDLAADEKAIDHGLGEQAGERRQSAVSFTQLTPPASGLGEISGGAGTFKKKNKQTQNDATLHA